MAKRPHETCHVRAAEPIRTCIATRKRFPRRALLRVVVDPQDSHRIIPDAEACLPGRGAWIQPTVAAYDDAVKRRSFARALKVPASADTTAVREYVEHVASLSKQQE